MSFASSSKKNDRGISRVHCPDNKVHGVNMGPTWVLSAPDGPHVDPMNLAIMVFYGATAVGVIRQCLGLSTSKGFRLMIEVQAVKYIHQ